MKNRKEEIRALDELWAKCVKALAGQRSELSGKTERLHAHHINGKPNYRLRYELENGICLTAGEHFFFAHNQGRMEDFREQVKRLRGADIYERLNRLKWEVCKTDLKMVRVFLEQKLKELA